MYDVFFILDFHFSTGLAFSAQVRRLSLLHALLNVSSAH